MVSKEQKKKQIKILRHFRKLTANGKGRMEAYERLAKEFGMSVSGIRNPCHFRLHRHHCAVEAQRR